MRPKMVAGHDGRLFAGIALGICIAFAVLLTGGKRAAASEDVIVIFDGSRSMWGQVAKKSKRRMVVDAVRRAFDTSDGSFPKVGLITYGSTAPSLCRDVTVLHAPGTADRQTLLKSLGAIKPRGLTPVSRALEAASRQFTDKTASRRIVLFADGTENCSGDPCAVARAMKKRFARLTIDVVALRVKEEDQATLACLAEITDGVFLTASTQADLNKAAAEVTSRIIARAAPLLATTDSPPEDAAVELAEANEPELVPTGPSPELLANPPLPPEHPNAADRKLAMLKLQETPEPQTTPAAAADDTAEAVAPATPAAATRETSEEEEADPIETASVPASTDQERIPDPDPLPDDPPPADKAELSVGDDEKPAKRSPGIKPEFDIEDKSTNDKHGVRLRARLTAGMRFISRPVEWTVYKVEDTDEALWNQVAAVRSAHPTIPLDPGDYLVRARYGYVTASKMISVSRGKLADTVFVLNAGGLRILSHLVFVDAPAGTTATHFVYTGDTDENGMRQLIAKSQLQGEIIRLNAGRYRIISRLGEANSVVSTDVDVNPGVLTAVEVNHKAGVLNLQVDRNASSTSENSANLVVFDAQGKLVLRSRGSAAVAILAPGTYTVSAEHNGRKVTRDLSIRIGESKAMSLTPE